MSRETGLPLKLINTTLGPKEVVFRQRQAQSGLLANKAHYWAIESLPFASALACVEIVLLRSDRANAVYYEVIKAWGLPGCLSIMDDLKLHIPESKAWQKAIIKARADNTPYPVWPGIVFDLYEQYKDNTDYLYLTERVEEFILVGFNRQIDQDNQAWKVLPGNALYLIAMICCRTLAEFCKVKLEDAKKYRRVQTGDKIIDLDPIMSGNPTSRNERRIKQALTRAYKRYSFCLRHDTKLLKDADQWYKSRVSPGTIEAYVDELGRDDKYQDRSNVETAIAPCDEATGYPRRWRKST